MPRSTYTLYENEKRDLPIEVLVQLADLYRTTCDELVGYNRIIEDSIAI